MRIDTPLLITGGGPAALVAARVASGSGLQSLLAGYEPVGGEAPVVLDPVALAVLTPHGDLEVLRPYLVASEPPTIAPALFEGVLKHHCVVDMNITVYDGMRLLEVRPHRGGVTGALFDGRTRIELSADRHIEARALPRDLGAAISAGAAAAHAALASLAARRPTPG